MSSQVSKSCPKPYGCEDCSRSFATRPALRAHCLSVGHGLACTARGCSRTFLSSTALSAHLSSSAHVKPAVVRTAAPTTNVQMDVRNSQSQVSGPFPCTVPGCKKTFKTPQSRAQHQEMASHGRKQTPPATQTLLKTVAPLGQQSETVTSGTAHQTETKRSDNALEIGAGSQSVATAEPELHNPNSAKCLKKSVNAPNSAGSSLSHTIKPPVSVPLFPWDTRWSKVPSTRYESTISALRAVVSNPASWCFTGVDKAFWTPDHKAAPSPDSTISKRQAIVLDCEMVGIGPKGTTSELARLSAVDLLTGELLIDTLVEPIHPITDLRTKWSGITAESMDAAVASGKALKGSSAARTQLFQYIDSRTILIGHSLQYDLEALGIRHGVTVDSATLAEAAVGRGVKRRWGLKVLCKEWLRIAVQENGKDGHDSVEDALAAREVVLWCVEHKKELEAWGKRKRKEYYSEGARSKKKSQVTRPRKTLEVVFFEDDSDEFESELRCLSVRELNELCHYPEWYDNWSD